MRSNEIVDDGLIYCRGCYEQVDYNDLHCKACDKQNRDSHEDPKDKKWFNRERF